MVDETNIQAKAAADAPAKLAETVADTAVKIARDSEKSVKLAQARTKRQAKAATARKARAATRTTAKVAKAAKSTARRAKAQRRTTRSAKPVAAANQRINEMTNDATRWFAGFNALPTATPFQSLFADAGERSQEAARRSAEVAEDLAQMTRANVEALTEAGRIAAEGARALGRDVVETSRKQVEQTADAVRSLAEAKSPTEFLQIQGDLARSSFDRMVSESSRLTESLVKLAGEAFQPLSNRASLNAESVNKYAA